MNVDGLRLTYPSTFVDRLRTLRSMAIKELPVVRERLPDDGECINPAPFEQKFGLRQTAYEFVFMGAQPGRWRVWAIDKDRRHGVKSPWRRFIHTK